MGPVKILIADDEPDIALILKTTLMRNGYTVVVAADGEEESSKSNTPTRVRRSRRTKVRRPMPATCRPFRPRDRRWRAIWSRDSIAQFGRSRGASSLNSRTTTTPTTGCGSACCLARGGRSISAEITHESGRIDALGIPIG